MERENVTIKDVSDLNVYQKAYRLSLHIHQTSFDLPKHEQYELASQMRRASKSICANLAEGYGKQSISKPEFKRYLLIAIGSADEMRLWLQYCIDLGYLQAKQGMQWQQDYRDIAKMLTGLHNKWG